MSVENLFQITDDGLRCCLRVIPNARENKICGIIKIDNDRYALKLSVTAVPEKGKANKAVIKFLSKLLNIPKTKIDIISGATSRNKTLLISSDENSTQQKLGLITKFNI